jgi:DNA polymerase V
MMALVECNNFYVFYERVFNIRVRNQPFDAISLNSDVAAERLQNTINSGSTMEIPSHQNDLTIRCTCMLPCSHQARYSDLSSRMTDVISQHTSHVDVSNIDELSFLFEGFETGMLKNKSDVMWHQECKKLGVTSNRPYLAVSNSEHKPMPFIGRVGHTCGMTHSIHPLTPGFTL